MNLAQRPLFLAALLGLVSVFVPQVSAEAVRHLHVEAELVPATTGIVPGETFTVGLRLDHDPHWHTYWKTTATGYASSLDWDLPEGFAAGEIQWTVPEVYDFAGYIEYVYNGEIVLPVEIKAPADLAVGDTITIKARAAWLMCEKTCIPGHAELSLTLPVVEVGAAEPDPVWNAAFQQAADNLPVSTETASISAHAWRDGETAFLELEGAPEALAGDLYFFDEQTFILPEATQPKETLAPNRVRLSFPVDAAGVGEVETFAGVVRTTESWIPGKERPAVAISVPMSDAPPPGATAGVAASDDSEVSTAADSEDAPAASLLGSLLPAFLGGLILNLMPCVFPVLGIKVMGFVNQAGEERGKVIGHGLVFAFGVLLSFWILAGVLLILRSGGAQLGWGFQLQNPVFVYFLAVFLLLFALNMSGIFEVGTGAIGVGSGLTARSGLSGSFFSGVLATVVATPCAAPFLAGALGAALTLPPLSSLAVFTAIGIGLATPYLVLSAFPALVQKLPRPGAWMESFKQGMAFLLYGTVAFLLWVLVGQLTESGGFTSFAFLWALFGLLGTALAGWIYGRWAAPHKPNGPRRIAMAAAALVLLGGLYGGYPAPAYDVGNTTSSDAPAVTWEKWHPGKAEELAAEGKTVYVDFTARWCVTCQSNKAVVFSSAEVRRFFARPDVVALKADWTNADPEISAALESWGRSAVPFNLVYGPAQKNAEPLPELLTPGVVLEAMKAAAGSE
jgi:thiol:disulfide interchange protein DsbD